MEIKLKSHDNITLSEQEKEKFWDNYSNSLAIKLDEALSNSIARWKIVIGHHPMYSQGTI